MDVHSAEVGCNEVSSDDKGDGCRNAIPYQHFSGTTPSYGTLPELRWRQRSAS